MVLGEALGKNPASHMKLRTVAVALVAFLPVAACSGSKNDSGFGDGTSSSGSSGGSGSSSGSGGASSSSGGSSGSDSGFGMFGNDGSMPPPMGSCQYQDGTDHDGDGFSYNDGDCNDCDPNTNPRAFAVP